MCLGQNDYIDFREILRNDSNDDFIKEKIQLGLNTKSLKHDFLVEEDSTPYMKRHMNVTGG